MHPVRWVLEGQHSIFLGAQRDALSFSKLTKLGGGLELACTRIPWFGIIADRVAFAKRPSVGITCRAPMDGLARPI